MAVAAGTFHTVGLRADGTVVAAGLNDNGQCAVYGWEDIVKRLRRDLIARSDSGRTARRWCGREPLAGKCDPLEGYHCRFDGIRSHRRTQGGRHVVAGSNDAGQCDVSGWADIIAVSAGIITTVGLRRRDRIDYGQAVVADDGHTTGRISWRFRRVLFTPFIRADGTGGCRCQLLWRMG